MNIGKLHGQVKSAILCTAAALILLSCSTSQHTSDSLANQGILALSTSNAYLGTNLYLASQAEQSNILYRFLQNRGGPTALSLVDEKFSSPRMFLYYARDREVYAADLEEKNGLTEWIVRGPFVVNREDYITLQRLENSTAGEPVLSIFGNEQRMRREKTIPQEHTVLTPKIPLPVITPEPVKVKPSKKPANQVITAPKELPPITDFSKINSDQQAILISQGYAERADNGDILHTVKGSEAIPSIVKWYTGSTSAQKEVESLNSIAAGTPLAAGTKVRIPVKLLKNLKAMPENFK